MLVEGRHFRRDWSSAEDVGRRAAAANLADIAAMGACCTSVVVAFAGPADLPTAWALEVMAGISRECAEVGAAVVGGDVSSADQVIIAITALGDLQGRTPVTRSGAHPGEVLALAGRVGWAEAGLTVLRQGIAESDALAAVVQAHRVPTPPYAAGPAAALAGATSMIDVSDGLVGDAGHLARMSGVTLTLRRSALTPLAEAVELVEAGRVCGVDPLEWILAGGDDHALLATFPAGVELPPDFHPIGRVDVRGAAGVTIDGQVPSVHAHEHFRP
jgi:thiamine-monophosphate kinase